MISLAPFAISQRLQPPDKLLVSVRGNGIQRPGEALSVSRSLSQIRQQGEPQLASGGCKRFFKKDVSIGCLSPDCRRWRTWKRISKACIC